MSENFIILLTFNSHFVTCVFYKSINRSICIYQLYAVDQPNIQSEIYALVFSPLMEHVIDLFVPVVHAISLANANQCPYYTN